MTAAELINRLSAFPPDADVYIYADHGQNYEDATSVEYDTADDAYYYIDDIEPDPKKVVAIIHGL